MIAKQKYYNVFLGLGMVLSLVMLFRILDQNASAQVNLAWIACLILMALAIYMGGSVDGKLVTRGVPIDFSEIREDVLLEVLEIFNQGTILKVRNRDDNGKGAYFVEGAPADFFRIGDVFQKKKSGITFISTREINEQ